MEKISENTTKPPVQCQIENYKNPENSSKILLQPIQLVRRLLRMDDIALLEALTPHRAVML